MCYKIYNNTWLQVPSSFLRGLGESPVSRLEEFSKGGLIYRIYKFNHVECDILNKSFIDKILSLNATHMIIGLPPGDILTWEKVPNGELFTSHNEAFAYFNTIRYPKLHSYNEIL